MKKRVICLIMAAMMAVAATGCSKKQPDLEPTSGAQTENENQSGSYEKVDYKDYAVLGDYKSIKVSVDRTQLEVSEEEIQEQIDATLAAYATRNEIKEGTVKSGDIINLDFSGLLDGVAFANGTATDVEYTVGGGYDYYGQYTKYIDDLDNGLVGLEVGKEYEIPCRFPDDYGSEDLKGKDVIFVVTVNHIVEEIQPEFNDEFVQQTAKDNGTDLSTTADMIADIKSYLSEYKQQVFGQDKYKSAMEELIAGTEFKEFPKSELEYLKNTVRTNIEKEYQQYGSYYSATSVENFYEIAFAPYYGYGTLDEFIDSYAEEFLKEKMVVTLLAEKENLTVSDEELRAYGEEMATGNGYESYDALIAQFGDVVDEEFRYSLLQEKVMDYVVKNIGEK